MIAVSIYVANSFARAKNRKKNRARPKMNYDTLVIAILPMV